MEVTSCSRALHSARKRCAEREDRPTCEEALGVYASADACPCERPTRCRVSGNSEERFVCVANAPVQPEDQLVFGMPVYGGSSRLVREEEKSREGNVGQ